MTSWGPGGRSQLPTFIVFTDYNLLFKGEEQLSRFASLQWIAKPIVVYVSELVENNPLREQKNSAPSVVYEHVMTLNFPANFETIPDH